MKKVAILVCFIVFISLGGAEAKEPVSITGVHWSFVPVLDLKQAELGSIYSQKYGVSIFVTDRWKEDGKKTLIEAVQNWKEVEKDAVIQSIDKGKLNGLDYIQIRATSNTVYNYIIFFIETTDMITEVCAIGKEKFLAIENEIIRMINTFQWQEDLPIKSLPYTLELPEGWKLAEMSSMVDYFSRSGKYPYVEEPDLKINYIKNISLGADLKKKLNFPLMDNYSDWDSEIEELMSGEWPVRIWYLSEKGSNEPTMFAGRIATDCFIFNFEADKSEEMTREVFRNLVLSWRYKGDENRSYFKTGN